MNSKEFFDKVNADARFEYIGVAEASNEVVVHSKVGTFALHPDAILNHTWVELESVLTGVRECKIMTHITRIVGYYSHLLNWNRSKLAELRDRHKGSYGVSGGDGNVTRQQRSETPAAPAQATGVA